MQCSTTDLTALKQRVRMGRLSEFVLALLVSTACGKNAIAHVTCATASKEAELGELGILSLISFSGDRQTCNTILRDLVCFQLIDSLDSTVEVSKP